MPFPCVRADPGAKPSEPFRERLECCEGGNTGRRTDWPCRMEPEGCHVAVRSAPGRDRAEAVGIGSPPENASSWAGWDCRRAGTTALKDRMMALAQSAAATNLREDAKPYSSKVLPTSSSA